MPRFSYLARLGVLLAVPLIAAALAGQALAATEPSITTIAGGVGGPGAATGISLGSSCGLTFAQGTLYAASGQSKSVIMRAISAATGRLTSPVGDGYSDLAPDGTPGPLTGSGPSCGIAIDKSGDLIWSDSTATFYPDVTTGHDLIRMLAAKTGNFYGRFVQAGRTYTLAGDGMIGYSGDGGPAVDAEINGPAGLAVDQGNIVFSDTGNNRIRVIAGRSGEFDGRSMTAGDIYTIAGGGAATGNGESATDAALQLIPADWSALGAPPDGLRIDQAGNIVFSDTADCEVRVIAAANGFFYGTGMTQGDLYTIAGTGTCGAGRTAGVATSTVIAPPLQLAIDGAGDVIYSQGFVIWIIAVASGHAFGRQVNAGHLNVLTRQASRNGLAVDAAGNLLFGTLNGRIDLLANKSGTDFGKKVTAGHLTSVAGNAGLWNSGSGGPASLAQLGVGPQNPFRAPRTIVADQNGDIALAVNGGAQFIPARTGTYFGRHLRDGYLYPVPAPSGPGCSLHPTVSVLAIAFDRSGNLISADRVCQTNDVFAVAIRAGRFYGIKMQAGHPYEISSGQAGDYLHAPKGLAVDPAGDIVITLPATVVVIAEHTGRGYCTHLVTGHRYTIAGQGGNPKALPAIKASIAPGPVAIDHAGNVLIGEPRSGLVQLIAEHNGTAFGQIVKACDIYTIAGGGTSQANGALGINAEVTPAGIRIDPNGNLLIADGDQVRVVADTNGVYYGQRMHPDDIYTIAGNGRQGFSGDHGPAAQARLWNATAIGIAPDHRILVLDAYRVRVISS